MWNCDTKEKFDLYLDGIDKLYNDIKNNGYKLNTDEDKVEVYRSDNDKNMKK